MATRNKLVAAKSQHLPDERWFVTGEPSKGIFTLKVCVSAIVVEGERMMEVAALVERAERASRF